MASPGQQSDSSEIKKVMISSTALDLNPGMKREMILRLNRDVEVLDACLSDGIG